MNVAMFNQTITGFSKDNSVILACHREKPISMAYIECQYGNIVYRFHTSTPSYNLKYKHYEVDVDYTYNELERGYSLKAAMYSRDQIIGFKSIICSDLRNGLIDICEEMVDELT